MYNIDFRGFRDNFGYKVFHSENNCKLDRTESRFETQIPRALTSNHAISSSFSCHFEKHSFCKKMMMNTNRTNAFCTPN